MYSSIYTIYNTIYTPNTPLITLQTPLYTPLKRIIKQVPRRMFLCRCGLCIMEVVREPITLYHIILEYSSYSVYTLYTHCITTYLHLCTPIIHVYTPYIHRIYVYTPNTPQNTLYTTLYTPSIHPIYTLYTPYIHHYTTPLGGRTSLPPRRTPRTHLPSVSSSPRCS